MVLPSGRPKITDENPGPVLALLAISSAVVSALVAGSCLVYQLRHRHVAWASSLDFLWFKLLLGGLAVSIAQSVVTAIQVQHGLGFQADLLTPADARKLVQLEYANGLLYIGALFLLKTVQFLLQYASTLHKAKLYVPGVVMAGMVGFFLAAAFPCRPPFWQLRSGRCFNQWAFWIAFGILDILSDLYAMAAVMKVDPGVLTRSSPQAKLIVTLGAKFLPVVCAAARLPFLRPAYTSADYTIEMYRLGIPTQLQLHLLVAVLCLVKTFRFLNLVDEGWMTSAIAPTHDQDTENQSSTRGSKGYAYTTSSGRQKSISSDQGSSKGLVPVDYGKTTAEVSALPVMTMPGRDHITVTRHLEIKVVSDTGD